ncbi:MAG: acetate--CoA ligase [Solirubrobacteraceae bacterium]|nr:acetate--CoA ligase [Solirubrobacteraceae bacterium]
MTTPQFLEALLEDRLAAGEDVAPSAAFAAAALDRDDAARERAAADPQGFWADQAAELLEWTRPWDTVLDDSRAPHYRWFAGGGINASTNALDRHVAAGNGARVAYHWEGEEGERRDVTYSELLDSTERLANVLRGRGIGEGDVVGIYLPMVPEVAVAMLACARIGAIHNVVFGGFSVESVCERMDVSNAKALITSAGARRKGKAIPTKQALDPLLEQLPSIETVIVVPTAGKATVETPMKEGRDLAYAEVLAAAEPHCDPAPTTSESPLFILYSSGSTAKPKGILHGTGGYLTGVAWTFRHTFDLKDDDVYFCTADVGWVTGHSYMVYGPLLAGATSVMYEGAPDYPHKGIWWELVERHGATIFYTAPTAIRACMKWGAEIVAQHDRSTLRLLGTVGEPINPKAWHWYSEVVGSGQCPVVDTWWQTETGHVMVTTLPGVDNARPGSCGKPLPGVSVAVVNEDGSPAEAGQHGLLTITQPWPGMLQTLYGDDERYVETYFKQFGAATYVVGDFARMDEDGYLWVIGRADDVIKVSGHRLSTAEVESALVSHHEVAEAAVVGMDDEDTGQAIVAFVTLEGLYETDGADRETLSAELREHVATRIGKLARPKAIYYTPDLPKTRSGKIMRRILRNLVEGKDLGDTSTLRDPTIVDEIAAQVKR